MLFQPLKWSPFFKVKVIQGQIPANMPLTPYQCPYTVSLEQPNTFGEKCKNVILDPYNGPHFPKSRSFRVKFQTACLLHLPMSLPKFHWNNQIDWRKVQKKGSHFPRSRSFEDKFPNKVPLTPSNVSTKFLWNNQNRFGKKCKNAISDLKTGHHFPRSRSFEVNFMDKVPPTPSNVLIKFHLNTQNTLGKKVQKCDFRHLKWLPFPEVKVV